MHTVPRSAYVHVPFCARRCGYCDFAVVADRLDLVADYLRAIEVEMHSQGLGAEVDTLYFGGGTPSQLSAEDFDRLCDLALAWRPLASNYEWTVEANPADVSADWVAQLASRGVTRLSLGGQSFNENKLRLLERDHSAEAPRNAYSLACEAGLDACLDLIFAAPGETLEQWRADVAEAVALKPTHVSTYGLTFERGTSFWTRLQRGDLIEASDGLQREMYLTAIDDLSAAGLEHYEVSNFARAGHRSRHNQAYWSGDGYFAVGPGAARYVDGVRETNHRSTATYLRRMLSGESPVVEREELSPEERARELLVFSLRQIDGVNTALLRQKSGFSAEELAGEAIEKYKQQGLLEETRQTLRLTREGLLVSDALWPALL